MMHIVSRVIPNLNGCALLQSASSLTAANS